ncbi:hypothetical protein GCM10022197_03890 [Microlunatus spumicola]|uniref:Uncharacterized protein n=1 Tax=Microlunatus spumicola TaxID=81499 RepID=A0ABP6WJE9_9ACTN
MVSPGSGRARKMSSSPRASAARTRDEDRKKRRPAAAAREGPARSGWHVRRRPVPREPSGAHDPSPRVDESDEKFRFRPTIRAKRSYALQVPGVTALLLVAAGLVLALA